MANVNKFLNTLDIFYCESYEPIDFGYGAGCAGIYAELFENAFKGNGLKGIDRYGNGDIFKSGFGEGNANYSNDIKNKGYGKPHIKD